MTHFEEGRVGREKFIRGKRKVEGFFVEGGVWMVEGEYSKVGKRIVKVRFWGVKNVNGGLKAFQICIVQK